MKTITSTQAVKELPTILHGSKIEPVEITKRNRKHAVIISSKEYESLKSNEDIDDRILWTLATYALEDGLLSDKKSKEFMEKLSNFSV